MVSSLADKAGSDLVRETRSILSMPEWCSQSAADFEDIFSPGAREAREKRGEDKEDRDPGFKFN